MIVISAIAAVAASTLIYSIENTVDRKITAKVHEKKMLKQMAESEQISVPEAPADAPVVQQVNLSPVSVPEAGPTTREAALEAELQQMRAAFAQLQSQMIQQAQTAAKPAAADSEPLVKRGQIVSICSGATPMEGDLDSLLPPDNRVGKVVKVNSDGTVKVNVSLGKKGSTSITVDEEDVVQV